MASEKDKEQAKSDKTEKAAEQSKESGAKKEEPAKEGGDSKEMSSKKLILLMSVAFLVILIITIVIVVMMLRPSAKDHSVEAPKQATVAHGEAATPTAEGASAKAASPEPATPVFQAQFIKIEPSFIVNFANNQNIRFLEVAVTLVTKTESEANYVKNNMPFIKDQLVTLFSAQKYDDIKTQQGKDLLRGQALTVVQSILEKQSGNKCVTDILFTSFVMQ